MHTVGGDKRLIGNIVVALARDTSTLVRTRHSELVGFENHSGRTYLGPGVRPLGRVVRGFGNNGEDGTEGAVYRNVFGCYMHGSLLPKNPHFADHLFELALQRREAGRTLPPLDDTLELAAHRVMVERLVALMLKPACTASHIAHRLIRLHPAFPIIVRNCCPTSGSMSTSKCSLTAL